VKSKPSSSIWRFALGITQEPAARLPYLALARDQRDSRKRMRQTFQFLH
jgi:hypothetical protein